MAKRLYVAYGSNLNLRQMQHRCPTATVVGTSEIEDYTLVFRGSKTGSYATIEPQEGSTVPVVLWDIKKNDELNLDAYEGYPNFYYKDTLDLNLTLKDSDKVVPVKAMVYIMPQHFERGEPSQIYINTIAEGYANAGFDLDILYDAIEQNTEQITQERDEAIIDQLYLDDWDMKW